MSFVKSSASALPPERPTGLVKMRRPVCSPVCFRERGCELPWDPTSLPLPCLHFWAGYWGGVENVLTAPSCRQGPAPRPVPKAIFALANPSPEVQTLLFTDKEP